MIVKNGVSFETKKQNKWKRFLFIFVVLLYLFVQYLYHTKSISSKFLPINLIFTKNNQIKKNMSKILLEKKEKNEWIVQYDVAQYSSIIVEQSDGTVDVEALFFHDNSTKIDDIKKNVKCLAFKSNESFLEVNIHEMLLNPFEVLVIDAPASIWVIKCKIIKKLFLDYQIHNHVAIIDLNTFKKHINTSNEDGDHMIILKTQKPAIFKRSLPKKKQIAHCVHTVYGLNDSRLKNLLEWLFFQCKLNFSKIILYFHQINNDVNKVIKRIRENKFNESFVEIIQYKNQLKDFCESKNVISNESCKHSYKIHFSKVRQKHEKINTNDCYLNHKYAYEYVSNFDFDELIFPRQVHTLDQSQLLNSNYTMPKYDIYSYAKYLHNLFGGANVSYLHFQNTFMLIKHRSLLEKILKYTNKDKTSNKSFEYRKDNTFVQLKLQANDSELVEKFWKRAIPLIDRLNESIKLRGFINGSNSHLFNTKWNNAYSLISGHRAGKSIYVTDNTLTINVHAADNVLKGTTSKTVPLNYGFVSHFRNDFNVNGDGKVINFDKLKYDLEYFLFFSSLFN